MSNYIIAIDGPTASGKGTIAKKIAKYYGIPCLDTGSIYRAICIYFMDNNIAPENLEQIEKHIQKVKIEILPNDDGDTCVSIDSEDVTERLHTVETSKNVPHYAKLPIIRERAVLIQKQAAEGQSIVCEGRDITSVVFPNAQYKFYLTSSLKVRAKRRFNQEIAKGEKVTLAQVTKGIADRDYLDMTRDISPLVHVKDAKLIDSSKLNVQQTVEALIKSIEKTKNKKQKKDDFTKPSGANLLRKFCKIMFTIPYRMLYCIQVKNRKELKKHRGKPVIFAMNHRSNADVPTVFVTFIGRKLHFIGKESLFKDKTACNWFLRSLNGVPIRPGKNDLAIIRHSLGVLKKGETLLIFPEGKRAFSPEDALALRNGTTMIAMKSGVPVVPIVTNRAPRPFRINKIKLGKTLFPSDFTDKTEFSNALRDNMASMLDGFEKEKRKKKWDCEPIVNTRGITIVDNKIVLIKRVRENETYYSFPGGHVDEGENPRDCVLREMKEETNIETEVVRLLYKCRLPISAHQAGKMEGFYLCQYKSGTVSKTNAPEYQKKPEDLSRTGAKWGIFEPATVDLSEIANLDVRPNAVRDQLVRDIEKYGKHLTRPTKFIK